MRLFVRAHFYEDSRWSRWFLPEQVVADSSVQTLTCSTWGSLSKFLIPMVWIGLEEPDTWLPKAEQRQAKGVSPGTRGQAALLHWVFCMTQLSWGSHCKPNVTWQCQLEGEDDGNGFALCALIIPFKFSSTGYNLHLLKSATQSQRKSQSNLLHHTDTKPGEHSSQANGALVDW